MPALRQANNSGEVPDTHSVGPVGNDNLGVFTVTEIAMKGTDAVPPTHLVPRTPNMTYAGLRGRRPSAPLTSLARLTGWQSLSTGHLAPHWKRPICRVSG